ncbi:hypothetical protein C8Q77DRAFT_1075868 [Trametes polyzona]|nr:hypothetical protein C8Q77DRAFT_1075868 [Trametes polyzona]
MVQLPPEVCSAIVRYAASRDLPALSCTSKAFQRAAEPRIYENMTLRDAQSVYLACYTLLGRDQSRGAYVKRLVIYQDPRRITTRNNLSNTPPQFWLLIQHALIKTVNLESLVIQDPTVSHSWILDHEDIKFQLREAALSLPWDSHLVTFLQTQHKLLSLSTDDSREDGPLYPLSPHSLPILEVYYGPILVVAELLGSPLKRLKMRADDDTVPLIPTIVSDLAKLLKTLRNLCILGLPEELLLETTHLLSNAVFAPQLRYLGVLPLPSVMREWHYLHRCLIKFPALTVLELDLTHLIPHPPDGLQRAILHDLRIYCPSLQQVVFWISQHRLHWYCRNGQWLVLHHSGRHQGQDNLWRT